MALSSFRSISSFGSVTCYSGLRARLLTRVPNMVTSIIVTANETLLRSLKTMEKYYVTHANYWPKQVARILCSSRRLQDLDCQLDK